MAVDKLLWWCVLRITWQPFVTTQTPPWCEERSRDSGQEARMRTLTWARAERMDVAASLKSFEASSQWLPQPAHGTAIELLWNLVRPAPGLKDNFSKEERARGLNAPTKLDAVVQSGGGVGGLALSCSSAFPPILLSLSSPPSYRECASMRVFVDRCKCMWVRVCVFTGIKGFEQFVLVSSEKKNIYIISFWCYRWPSACSGRSPGCKQQW